MIDVVLTEVRLIVMGHFADPPDPVVRDADISVLGLDDETVLEEFLYAVRERLGVSLSSADLASMETIDDLCRTIERKRGA